MKGGGGSGGDTTIHYASYIEEAHSALISRAWAYTIAGDPTVSNTLAIASPFTAITIDDPDLSFFGTGYTIASFPTLYDMFGKFMAGLDIESLWEQIYEGTVNSPALDATITAQSVYLQDDIDNTAMPKIKAGYRDINAVMSTSYVTASTLIQSQKLKAVAKFSAEVKQHGMDVALQRWAKHMEWNTNVITQYMQLNKLYWSVYFDYINVQGELASKNALWPFTLFDHMRSITATLNGSYGAAIKGQPSATSRAISGALGGAAMGGFLAAGTTFGSSVLTGATSGLVGGPAGAIVGGLLGLGASMLSN